MSKLWRTTSYLFWQYPKLWLPVLAAEVASYSVRYLQQAISQQIVLWVHRSGSVLSSGQDSFVNRSEAMKAAIFAAPFVWGRYFISIFLYTCALLATARILAKILNSGAVGFTIQSRVPYALKFSLKCFALSAACAILFMFPITSLALELGPRGLLTNPFYPGAITLLLTCAIAFIMAPQAVRLVSVAPVKISSDQAASSRVSACLASAASISLGLAVSHAHISGWNSWPRHEQLVWIAINLVIGIVTAIPYIPLFIALSLIADSAVESPGNLQLQTPGPTEGAASADAPV